MVLGIQYALITWKLLLLIEFSSVLKKKKKSHPSTEIDICRTGELPSLGFPFIGTSAE